MQNEELAAELDRHAADLTLRAELLTEHAADLTLRAELLTEAARALRWDEVTATKTAPVEAAVEAVPEVPAAVIAAVALKAKKEPKPSSAKPKPRDPAKKAILNARYRAKKLGLPLPPLSSTPIAKPLPTRVEQPIPLIEPVRSVPLGQGVKRHGITHSPLEMMYDAANKNGQ